MINAGHFTEHMDVAFPPLDSSALVNQWAVI